MSIWLFDQSRLGSDDALFALGRLRRLGRRNPRFNGQNVASRGMLHTGTTQSSGAKTRMKGITRFVLGQGGAKSLQAVFANLRLNNAMVREVMGPAYTIRKAAYHYEGKIVPATFNGARTKRVAPGEIFSTDLVTPEMFGVTEFRAGYVPFLRQSIDLPAGQAIPAQDDIMYAEGESQLLYDPANDIDDIDTAGWTIPTGADQWIAFPHPVMLCGKPITPVTSVVGVGHSILFGAIDVSGDGTAGGGWARRATFAAGLPYLSLARGGDKAQFVAASHEKTVQLIRMAGAHAALIDIGCNDLRDGRSTTQLLADLREVWSILRSKARVGHIAQALILSETTSTDQHTSIAGQTIRPRSEAANGVVNSALRALDGGRIDDVLDLPSTVQSRGKWNVPAFAARLTADVSPYAGVIQLDGKPEVGDFLTFEPGTANQDQNWFHVTRVTGAAAPYTVHLVAGPAKSHAAGTIVRASLSEDGVHPQQQGHKKFAVKAAAPVRRIAAIQTPWHDRAKTFEIDFVNRRAQLRGLSVPIASLVSCRRASAGKAFDGQTWFDIAVNQLRYADGGGLHVEPARTNMIRNSVMEGGAPNNKPPSWAVNLPTNVAAAYAYGETNGIPFVDIRFTSANAGGNGVAIDIETGIPTKLGDAWVHSAFLANVGEKDIGITGMNIGGRAGASNGSATEFPSTGGLKALLTRELALFAGAFTIQNANSTGVNSRIGVNFNTGATVDFTLRIGCPQFELGEVSTSYIPTPLGSTATRAADEVTLLLPFGVHDLLIAFDDGSTQAFEAVSDRFILPINPRRPVIRSISATSNYAYSTDDDGAFLTDSDGAYLMEKI